MNTFNVEIRFKPLDIIAIAFQCENKLDKESFEKLMYWMLWAYSLWLINWNNKMDLDTYVKIALNNSNILLDNVPEKLDIVKMNWDVLVNDITNLPSTVWEMFQ